jgi:hypothetical protein
MIFELDQTRQGDWDRFQLRNIGFAVQRLMAAKFGGDANRMRSFAAKFVQNTLGITSIGDLPVALLLINDLKGWSADDKNLLREIIKAKAMSPEAQYLHLSQRHERLRDEIIKLGSGQ